MNDWLIQQGISNPQMGMVLGLLLGLLTAAIVAWWFSRRNAVLETRISDREQHFEAQLKQLEQAETRLAQNFERLAGRIFEDRSARLSDLNSKQMDVLLRPLSEKLREFRSTVEQAHREETAQHRVMKEKISDLEKLNERLHQDATDLTRALTSNVKTQGNWGEQQLERLLEAAGLQKGVDFSSQYSVTNQNGQRIQPDLVLHLPEGKSIVLDSKVSLSAWIRFQACGVEDEDRARALKEHIQSIRQHVRSLGEKRYTEVPELNALDFVLMFVPIESALMEALQAEPDLADYALLNKVALLSPTNFLATMRTVASVWSVHKQNHNAQEIARRAGFLYDKFAGFVDNMQGVGARLDQAQRSYEKAFGQLTSGPGNLLRQTEQLRELGARSTRHLDRNLLEDDRDAPGIEQRIE